MGGLAPMYTTTEELYCLPRASVCVSVKARERRQWTKPL